MNNPAKSKPLLWIFLSLIIIAFGIGYYYLYSRIEDLSSKVKNLSDRKPSVDSGLVAPDTCGSDCLVKIEEVVSATVATLSGQSKSVIEKTTTVVQESQKTSYISLGSTAVTTSTDWVEVADSGIYIDLVKDYSEKATVSWEVSLKVAHGNGKAFARLYDDTNKIAVDFSELSTENNATFKQVLSGNLPFWKGRNLYKVQIKSLNSFEVTYSGGRVRISY